MTEDSTQTTESTDEIVAPPTIQDVFNDDPEPTEEVVQEKSEVETKSEESEPEKVEEEPEKEAETTAAESESVPRKALLDERRKRQELEKQLKDKETKAPDVFEDQEAYTKYLKDQNANEALNLKKTITREIMIENYDDYEKMEATFMEMVGFDVEIGQATKNLHLIEEMNSAQNPAKYAYEKAKEHLTVKEVTDPTYKEKLREQLKAEILAELKSGKPSMPDLSKASAAGTNSSEVKAYSNIGDVFAD